MKKIIVIIGISLSFIMMAQENKRPDCNQPHYREFDFWLGDWSVSNTKGEMVGSNKVVRMQDGCVVQENWVASSQNNTGTSYNFYDRKDGFWHQIWISNNGNILRLKGELNSKGAMVLKSEWLDGSKGKYLNQITWNKNPDGTVTQKWDVLNENNESIAVAFEGIYKLK